MSKQVLDIEQMKHLKELGVDTSNVDFFYERNKSEDNNGFIIDNKWRLKSKEGIDCFGLERYDIVPVFTLQEILNVLPKYISKNQVIYALTIWYSKSANNWLIAYYDMHNVIELYMDEELIDAAYNLLCWCIENGYIETNKQ